jgi:hypothetical protein
MHMNMHINRKIERFLIRYNYPTAKFGRDAVNDPRLVHDMRRGRTLGANMSTRIDAFMAAHAKAVAERLEALA